MPNAISVEQATAEGWYVPNQNGGMCECGCGESAPIAPQTRRDRGHVRGLPVHRAPGHGRRINVTGHTGSLTVVGPAPQEEWRSPDHAEWLVRCECGTEMNRRGSRLGEACASCAAARSWTSMTPEQRSERSRAGGLAGGRGVDHPNWKGDNIDYSGAHARVRRVRGPASDHPCAHCSRDAAQWAYDGTDPNEQFSNVEGRTTPYSADPTRYTPLCVPCHVAFDLGQGGRWLYGMPEDAETAQRVADYLRAYERRRDAVAASSRRPPAWRES